MKKIGPLLMVPLVLVIMFFLTTMLMGACGPSDGSCQLNWDELDVDPDDVGLRINMLLNNEWPPDSIGALLKKCIQKGWMP